jgi:hypothetical protein
MESNYFMKSKQLKYKLSIWNRRRHIIQCIVLVTYFILPLSLPTPLLHFDCAQWKINFFGAILVPGHFHILGLFIILLCFTIALSATFLGKLFCGWVCPQNIFYELFEVIHNKFKKKYPKYRKSNNYQKCVDLSLAFLFSQLIATTFLLYFTGANILFLGAFYTFITLFFTYDIGILKHKFCKTACPYAFLQHSFTDKNSLHILYENRQDNPCNSCQACYKSCYVGLDITKQFHNIDCTLCGACVDACKWVYSKKNTPPLLSFSSIKKKKKGLISTLYILFLITFIVLIINKPSYSLYIFTPTGNVSKQTPELIHGKQHNNYWINIRNLTDTKQEYTFILTPTNFYTNIKKIHLLPFENIHEKFNIQTSNTKNLSYLTPLTLQVYKNNVLVESKEISFQRTLK